MATNEIPHPLTVKEGEQCPRCDGPADNSCTLSRKDNATELCNDCGNKEAFEDMNIMPPYTGKQYWNQEVK